MSWNEKTLKYIELLKIEKNRYQLFNGGGESLYGLSVTLGQIKASETAKGISISGYKTEVFNSTGVNLTIAWTEFYNMTGFSFAGYNRIRGNQTGLTIGLVNYAENLNGLQLGLINIADNNSG